MENTEREVLANLIDAKFFRGAMDASWHLDIKAIIERYGFDETLVYKLFEYCHNKRKLNRAFILEIAFKWHSKSIKTSEDLSSYSIQEANRQEIKRKIIENLNIKRELTKYEIMLMEKWITQYKYSFNIIEQALRKTTKITNPNFTYIGKIIDNWFKDGVRTLEDIKKHEKAYKDKQIKQKVARVIGNFEQREYDDAYYEGLYENT